MRYPDLKRLFKFLFVLRSAFEQTLKSKLVGWIQNVSSGAPKLRSEHYVALGTN